MEQAFVTVTVRGGGRVVELPLPAEAPTAELTPALARLCHGDRVQPEREGTPAAWAFARPGGRPLPLTASLAQAGLRDGEVLQLVDVSAWDARPRWGLGSVVAAAVELGPRWTGRATSRLLSLAAVAAVLVAAALAARTAGPRLAAAAAALPRDGSPEVVAGAAAVLGSAILGLRLLPRLVAALAALPWPGAERAPIAAVVRRSRRLLAVLTWAVAAAVLAAVPPLLALGTPLFVVLGAVVVAGLVLSARSHRLVADVLPLALVAGTAPAALALGEAARLAAAGQPLAAVALLGGTGLALLGGAVALAWR